MPSLPMKSWLPLVVAAAIEAVMCERLPRTQGHALPGYGFVAAPHML
jgi:hypothetical protein